jgi:coenzyme F420-reducing hydrogenase alpha subunit
LGYGDAIQMAKDHGEWVKKGLQLKKVGNDLVALIGGREIHPINMKVGGFYRAPAKKELAALTERLKWARDAAVDTVRWTATLEFPDFKSDYEFVAMRHPNEYPLTEGRLVSNRGLDISVDRFDEHFIEEHVAHSNALHCVLRERGSYMVGPLARYSLNFDCLPSICQELAKEVGLTKVCTNPFQSIVIRSIEILFACEESLRILAAYEDPPCASVEYEIIPGTGFGCSEAPRGICYHRYTVDAEGLITNARIVPPTSQNQKRIEQDLYEFIPKYMDASPEELTWKCEQAVRNYDPCISCATHFLKLDLDRA